MAVIILRFEMQLEEHQIIRREAMILQQSRVEVPEFGRGSHFNRKFSPQRGEVILLREEPMQYPEVLLDGWDGKTSPKFGSSYTEGLGKTFKQLYVGLLTASASQFGVESLGKLDAHLQLLDRCSIQESLEELDEVFAEIMVLDQPRS